jgi:uncharacterized Zn finger protein (UPF0148 family)
MDAIPKDAKCCAFVYRPGRFRASPCAKAAKVERDGKLYCGTHDPLAAQARRDATYAKWKAEHDARNRTDERNARIRAARDAVVSMAQLAARQHATWDDVARAVDALAMAERAP